MNVHHVIVMLVLASCVWTTVICNAGECVICDHCEQKNASSYKKKCSEVKVGFCVTETYASGRVLRRCHRPGEKHDELCRDSIDPATSEKVQICSCEPGLCALGRWERDWDPTPHNWPTLDPNWPTLDPNWPTRRDPNWPTRGPGLYHDHSDFIPAWINNIWKYTFIALGVIVAVAIIVACLVCGCLWYRQKQRRAENMRFRNANIAAAGYPTGAAGLPTSATGYPTSATGFPASATGFPSSATGSPTSATVNPTSDAGQKPTPAAYPTQAAPAGRFWS